MKEPLIILFAKAPVPGRVKTRLAPVLAATRAADLHRRMVEHAWARLNLAGEGVSRELHTDVPTNAWPHMHPRRIQSRGDLGERMSAAVQSALAAGHGRCLIAGSDAPGLPTEHLRELLESSADVALGPTEDGGYYAIACSRVEPRMFDGVRWSTTHALDDTVRAAAACGLTVGIGSRWFDIDCPEDLIRLAEYPDLAEFASGTGSNIIVG